MPVVLATMHGAHGVGELAGAVQYGPPWAALALAAGLSGAAERAAMDETAVFAPSLHAADRVRCDSQRGRHSAVQPR